MAFVLTEEQTLLQDSAREFIRAKSPVTAFRALRDGKDETGFSRDLWKEMAEMGFAGILIPEEFGGTGFGYRGMGIVLEEAGRTLAATPLVSTALVGTTAILIGGNDEQRKNILPKIAAGDHIMALALEESPHHAPANVATTATKDGDGFKLSGNKTFVLDGHVADQLIVVARTSGKPGDENGITLFLVDGNAPGVSRQRTIMVDSRNAANVTLENVTVGADAVLGRVDGGYELLEETLDRARIGLAAEMLGGCAEVFERTLDYLKERKQFGVVIGSFQALKHRAAEMFCELELSKSVVMDALDAIDERRNDIAAMASLAKARLSETYELISNEGVQMHGGIGMTDEFDIGLYLKRARVAQATFGDALYHRHRYAALEGY